MMWVIDTSLHLIKLCEPNVDYKLFQMNFVCLLYDVSLESLSE